MYASREPGRSCNSLRGTASPSARIAVPLIEGRHADVVEQRHAVAGSLELVVVQRAHEALAVRRVLQVAELVLDRRRDALDGVSEEVQQEEALHLEADV